MPESASLVLRILRSRAPYATLRWLLGGFFTIAGLLKAADMPYFVQSLSDFGIVYEPLLFPTAVAMVVVEIVSGASLCWDLRYSLTAIAAQLFIFCGVLLYGISIGLDIECGCMGRHEVLQLGLTGALLRNLLLLLICSFLYQSRRHQTKPTDYAGGCERESSDNVSDSA